MEETETTVSKVRINFWVKKDLYWYIESVAARDGRSISDILREAIRDYQQKQPIDRKE